MSIDLPQPPGAGQGTRPRFVRLLRLVHPLPDVPPAPPRRRGRRAPPVFSEEEQRLLRAALRSARPLFGTWQAFAAVVGVHRDTLDALSSPKCRKPISAEIAVRLAKALKVPLDALITPGLRVVKDPCPTCGAPNGGAA